MDLEFVAQGISVILAIATAYFGVQFNQIRSLLRELTEAMIVTERYLRSPVISQKELRECINEWQDVLVSARSLLSLEGDQERGDSGHGCSPFRVRRPRLRVRK